MCPSPACVERAQSAEYRCVRPVRLLVEEASDVDFAAVGSDLAAVVSNYAAVLSNYFFIQVVGHEA